MENQSLGQVFVRIAQEDKAMKAMIQVLELKVGPLANLPTSSKNAIVASLIEIHGLLSGKVTSSEVSAEMDATKSEILGGAQASVDTLKELADRWAGQDNNIDGLITELGGILSFTGLQNLTLEQQALVLEQIGAISHTVVEELAGRITDLESNIEGLNTATTDRASDLTALTSDKNTLNGQLNKSLKVDADMGNTEVEMQQGRDNLSIASATALQELSESTQDLADTTDYLTLYLTAYTAPPVPIPVVFASTEFYNDYQERLNGEIRVGLENVANEFDFIAHIERSTDGVNFTETGTTNMLSCLIPGGFYETYFTDSGLNNNTTYYYRIRGEVDGQYSGYSDTVEVAGIEPEAPSDVTFLLANLGEYDLSVLDSNGNTTALLNGWVYSSGPASNVPIEVTGNRMRVDAPGRDWPSWIESGDVALRVKEANDPSETTYITVYLELDTLVGSVATFLIQPALSGKSVRFRDS